MKLTAYTYAGPWREWSDVAGWLLSGPRLIIRRSRTRGADEIETVQLPRAVIGLADDAPATVRASSQSTQYRPDPAKAKRNFGDEARLHESRDAPAPKRLRIPDAEPPRSRFGDSPRRRQFKGDGS